MTTKPTAEVTVTVTVDGTAKTFTASGETTGHPARTARGLLGAVSNDASGWIFALENPALARAAARR